MSDLSALRREYLQAGLEREDLASEPVAQFRLWFAQARDAGLLEPNAMVVSTVGPDAQPSSRSVLLKAFDERGFVFYTNYQSRKAREIEENPRVSALFPWYGLERQVIVGGRAERVSAAESLQYFMSRPHGSQLGAWVSAQSQVISSRGILEMKLAEMKRRFQEGKVPLPEFWGGIRIVAQTVEFWQGRPNRLHDRFLYEREAEGWCVQRLSP